MNVEWIKPLLILWVVFTGAVFLLRVRNPLPARLAVVSGIATAILLIIFPDVTTRIANVFGVGRGVDFIYYLLFCVLFLALVLLYSRYRENQAAVTALTREVALINARQGSTISLGDRDRQL